MPKNWNTFKIYREIVCNLKFYSLVVQQLKNIHFLLVSGLYIPVNLPVIFLSMCCHGTDLRFWPGRRALAIEMWMNMIYICHLWVGLFKSYCLIWFDITLTSLPSAVRMNILSRGYFISLRLWMIRYWAAEPRWACWVKQSSGWSTALVQCEPEINLCCCKLLRLRDCLSPEQNWKYRHSEDPYLVRKKFIMFSAFIAPLS